MDEITKLRTSKAVVLNTRPGLVAPSCPFSACPLEYRDGWLLNTLLPFPFVKLCAVETVFPVFCSLVM